MHKSGKRAPRFRRMPDSAGNMVLTSRDMDIIQKVGRLRAVRSTHLTRLIPGPKAQILRRLHLLYHHGWLDRPRSQLDYFHHGGGSGPMVYCLGRRGALLMRGQHGAPSRGLRWEGKGAAVGRIFLNHALAVTDVLVEAEMACRTAGGAVSYVAPEVLSGHGSPGLPFRWDSFHGGGRAVLIPDAVFGLEFSGAPADRRLVICCLEADRGTMPVIRSSSGRSSVHAKLECYARLWRRGDFEKRFGTGRLLVLMVAPGAERSLNIQKAAGGLPWGRGIFGFWTEDEIRKNFHDVIRHAENRRPGSEKAP